MVETILSLLMALLVLGFALFCWMLAIQTFWGHLRAKRLAKSSQSWSWVEGEVVSSELVHVGMRSGWKADVRYHYCVNGVDYPGDQTTFDYFDAHPLKAAQAIQENHQPHARVGVFYNPARPTESVLERVDHGDIWGLLWMPFFLLFPAIFCSLSGMYQLISSFKK